MNKKVRTRKVSRRFRPVTCWAEVHSDGTFTCYDLAPTRAGVESGALDGSRAVKVRIVKAR